MTITPYLHFSNGRCEEALNFYINALGAKPLMMMRYCDAPEPDGGSEEMAGKIMHGRLALGDSLIMASDSPPGRVAEPGGFSINIGVDDVGEAERMFKALSENGEIRMPFAETFWAEGFGMLVDQFGIPWMVNCEKSDAASEMAGGEAGEDLLPQK